MYQFHVWVSVFSHFMNADEILKMQAETVMTWRLYCILSLMMRRRRLTSKLPRVAFWADVAQWVKTCIFFSEKKVFRFEIWQKLETGKEFQNFPIMAVLLDETDLL